ncbi:preprotein translocase subunit SecG [Chitinophagaceae bacterium IBVUCB2]|nr:preprotein translocase subunit SecG [Chitinophagaceae bacterium IBVUCB2]
MTTIFIVLIVLASVILGLIVLVQNPKGGGLAGNIAGFSNQFMGVKQTTDVLEKGTWIFAGVIGLLCLFSVMFISKSATATSGKVNDATEAPVPATSQPTNTAPVLPTAPTTTPVGQ